MSDHEIAILYDKCQGYGNCAKRAPEFIRLDDKGKAQLIRGNTLDADAARKTARACPYRALVVSDPESGDQMWPPVPQEK